MTQHRLEGYISFCGDPQCRCLQPVIDEVLADGANFRTWEGTFYSDPSPFEEREMEEELREHALRHRMEEVEPGLWIRDV